MHCVQCRNQGEWFYWVPSDSLRYTGVTVTDGSSKPLTPIRDLSSTSFQMATVSVVASVLIRINISVGSSDSHWKCILAFQDKAKFFRLTAAGSLRPFIHLASIQLKAFLVGVWICFPVSFVLVVTQPRNICCKVPSKSLRQLSISSLYRMDTVDESMFYIVCQVKVFLQ